MDEKQYTIPTEITQPSEEISNYASISFAPGRPLFEAVFHLMQRIYKDFAYTSGFSTISTPLSDVFRERKGVCQDFAHFGIACMQAMGLPARYVSGYLETIAPPGKEKLTGAMHHMPGSLFIFLRLAGLILTRQTIKFPMSNILPCWGRNYLDIIPFEE